MDIAKKLTERVLVDEFISLCPDFDGYSFDRYDENPDLVYRKGDDVLGFESIIIIESQKEAECYFDAPSCTIFLPQKTSLQSQKAHLRGVISNQLFKHIRKYQIKTVLVFSVMGRDMGPTAKELSESFKMPEFKHLNIVDYYIFGSGKYAKIIEN